MINLKQASILAAVGMMLVPAAGFAADNDLRDVVKDARGNIVTSTDGNCVRTQWTSGADECNGVKAVAKHDIRSRLSKEERTVYFDFNKSTLNATEKSKLDSVSKIILDSKEVESVDIVGYADEIGKSSYNKKLSQKRAATVKAFLAARGLKTHNVRVEGLGEANSLTHCDKKMARKALIACLAPDRRVEIELNVTK
jgi:outer membrane protein OmpA-like peptidoglycan-associated protein